MDWMLCVIGFLVGWIVGGTITNALNAKLIQVQRNLIEEYRKGDNHNVG
ncbi:MAG: hypothetical protein ACRCYS_16540 [Beijerinckiaceae bacterium]